MLIKPKSVLIVGGGTAGWMTANSLLNVWPDVKISLVESEDIGVIGVGEGATPYLKQYFKQLGIAEKDWMPECDATYKLGISFEGWSGSHLAKSYFHPFFSVLDKPVAEMFFHNCGLRRRGIEAPVAPDEYFVAAQLTNQKVDPTACLKHSLDIDYAYHFDSVKLGIYLRNRAVKLGLTHVIDNVQDVKLDKNGDIVDVSTQQHGCLTADHFIDCTGFSSRLINKALKRESRSYSDTLFNNAAVAIQTQYTNESSIKPQTRSIALNAGWMWNIPLTTRQGNGYVYSDGHISSDQAETELRQALNIQDDANVKVRHLNMRIGRLNEHWHKNCLAVGLSQGFIEPLEATALMLTQLTIDQFVQSFASQETDLITAQNSYNQKLNQVFDGIHDYIVAHYQLTKRQDTDYWRDNKYNLVKPKILSEILYAWDNGLDVEKVLSRHKNNLVYLRPSWYCILAGMGRFPQNLKHSTQVADVEQARKYCKDVTNKYFLS
ncbi:tryptophan 7-halogenase [Paraglaciecola aquimarina]|uniref:Tryptophan 7-halogenase n=1 Tax=Paraglaciecola algarum TaxID=3050085 RepID=A0ABS9D7K0_9ALTE|nr:tryptophan halogenase family protein [Paraglaciecola sp. G1-23]MCF2948942.1 tryptophan 7-halogenase [Paraglaciecola sp. G1-23]